MWISKRYQRTIIQAQCRGQKQKRSRKTNIEPQNNAKHNEKTEFPGTVWNILPQGLWLKAEYFSIDQKREVGGFGNGVFQSLQNKTKGAMERIELGMTQQKRLDTALEMTTYVSQMMKDYFNSDNLQKVIENAKNSNMSATIQQKTNEALKTETEAKPKFIQKRENLQENYSYYSQSSIDSNTKHCVERLKEATTTISLTTKESIKFRLEEFNVHLNKFPLAAILANKMGAQDLVKNICVRDFNGDTLNQGLCRETLARLGYQEQLNSSPGIRILSIDGGGMKGVIALEILRKLEKKTGKKIHQLFDYCIGVSTGSIIIGLLALKKMSVDEAAQIYQDIGAQVFEQTYLKAVQGMVMSQAYYDTLKYETFLKDFAGEEVMATSVRDPGCPRVAFVSAIMSPNRHSVSPFIFRNYAMPFMVTSNYRGSSRFKTWEAVRASSAAPGFFDDFRTQGLVFQDGALIANNPSSVGLHEAKHLWPKEKLQCLVSLGLGRYEPLLIDPYEELQEKNTLSVKDKFSKLVLSATDTEMTDHTLRDLLPDDRYFRFNPYLSEIISMDETRLEKISLMQSDAQMFCRRNVRRLDLVSKLTTEKPTYLQRGKRKLLKSMETSNNSLTVPASMTTASAASVAASAAASTGIKSKNAGP